IDVAGGCLRGVDVVTWPEDIRTVDTLTIPEPSKEGSVTFPSRKSQPGVAAVEVDTALTVEKNQQESVFHLRVGRTRATTVVRVVRVLEIGALAGYSGVWLARALPSHGRLTTIEKDPRHAGLARRAFAEAGLAERVQLIEGAALAVLPALAPGFDAVFVDADK